MVFLGPYSMMSWGNVSWDVDRSCPKIVCLSVWVICALMWIFCSFFVCLSCYLGVCMICALGCVSDQVSLECFWHTKPPLLTHPPQSHWLWQVAWRCQEIVISSICESSALCFPACLQFVRGIKKEYHDPMLLIPSVLLIFFFAAFSTVG